MLSWIMVDIWVETDFSDFYQDFVDMGKCYKQEHSVAGLVLVKGTLRVWISINFEICLDFLWYSLGDLVTGHKWVIPHMWKKWVLGYNFMSVKQWKFMII